MLVGLAVGVDYTLFYLRREREERAAGRGERAALKAAAATSGRSVLISGATVMVAMAGMLVPGDPTFRSLSMATMVVVAIAMVGSLTVLPALLSKPRRPGREGADTTDRRVAPFGRRGPGLVDGLDPGRFGARPSRPSIAVAAAARDGDPRAASCTPRSSWVTSRLPAQRSDRRDSRSRPGRLPGPVDSRGDRGQVGRECPRAVMPAQSTALPEPRRPPVARRLRGDPRGYEPGAYRLADHCPAARQRRRRHLNEGAADAAHTGCCRRRSAGWRASATPSPARPPAPTTGIK